MDDLESKVMAAASEAVGAVGASSGQYGRPLVLRPSATRNTAEPKMVTLVDCRGQAAELVNRARDIVSTITDHANLAAGHGGEAVPDAGCGDRPSNGVVNDLWSYLQELSLILNTMVSENGRLGRALS